MLSRQSLWMPVLKHAPAFGSEMALFLKGSSISKANFAVLHITPECIVVALEEKPAPKKLNLSSEFLSYMMAFPAIVDAAACDVDPLTGRRALSVGFLTSLADTCNSIHVMERLMPHRLPHVSAVLRTEQLRPHPGVAEGERVVIVSTVDKMGKRLVYCKTDVYTDAVEVSEEVTARESRIKTLADLNDALGRYEKVMASTHIKNILPDKKWGQQ